MVSDPRGQVEVEGLSGTLIVEIFVSVDHFNFAGSAAMS